MSLSPDEIPRGSLCPDTLMKLTSPAHILKEWRIWVVGDRVVTFSLYKEGARVTYRPEIDDALGFARMLVARNPACAPACVMDICGKDDGLPLLETNCINARGFYAADVVRLAGAIDARREGTTRLSGPRPPHPPASTSPPRPARGSSRPGSR